MNGFFAGSLSRVGDGNRADTHEARCPARGHGMPCPYIGTGSGRGTACRAHVWGQGVSGWIAGRHVSLVLVFLGALLAAGPSGAAAQATPEASAFDVPAPEECRIALPEVIEFPPETMQPIAATPAPIVTDPEEPFTPPAGLPADAEMEAAVTATVREALACRNAGDFVRALALFTPNMLAELYGSPATLDPEVLQAVSESPRPVPEPRRLRIDMIGDVTALPDGRVGAIVETSNARREFRDFLYFARDPESGRWLIDGSVPLQ